MQEFGNKFMAKDYKSSQNKSPPKETDKQKVASPDKEEEKKDHIDMKKMNSNNSSQQSLK